MKILPPQGALTTRYLGRTNQLHNMISIIAAGGNLKDLKDFDGLWDTGATNTVITQKVVDELGLQPSGITNVFTPQGSHMTPTYIVQMLQKDSKLSFGIIKVSLGLLSNCDVLIGMDIISLGDFSVTNNNGVTVMSFRAPSSHVIDYVKTIEQRKNGHFATPKNRKKKRR